jgi:hypothetical protein
VTSTLDDDLRMLRACIARYDESDSDDEPGWYRPFTRMLDDIESGKWKGLSVRQSQLVRGVHCRLFDEPTYENAWSAGRVPRGNYGKTPTPEVLLKRPLKPPGRA